MNYGTELSSRWGQLLQGSIFADISTLASEKRINLSDYKGYLLETYHNTKWNPQLQGFNTMYLRGLPREIFSKFFRHAGSEVGHDLLALQDLVSLGVDKKLIINSEPLPSTTALNASTVFLMQFRNPLCYLGYLYHLEFLPTTQGAELLGVLDQLGIPESATSFIKEHTAVDYGHNKLMETYLSELIKTPADFEDILYALQVTVDLHSKMVESAMANGRRLFQS